MLNATHQTIIKPPYNWTLPDGFGDTTPFFHKTSVRKSFGTFSLLISTLTAAATTYAAYSKKTVIPINGLFGSALFVVVTLITGIWLWKNQSIKDRSFAMPLQAQAAARIGKENLGIKEIQRDYPSLIQEGIIGDKQFQEVIQNDLETQPTLTYAELLERHGPFLVRMTGNDDLKGKVKRFILIEISNNPRTSTNEKYSDLIEANLITKEELEFIVSQEVVRREHILNMLLDQEGLIDIKKHFSALIEVNIIKTADLAWVFLNYLLNLEITLDPQSYLAFIKAHGTDFPRNDDIDNRLFELVHPHIQGKGSHLIQKAYPVFVEKGIIPYDFLQSLMALREAYLTAYLTRTNASINTGVLNLVYCPVLQYLALTEDEVADLMIPRFEKMITEKGIEISYARFIELHGEISLKYLSDEGKKIFTQKLFNEAPAQAHKKGCSVAELLKGYQNVCDYLGFEPGYLNSVDGAGV